MSWTGRRVHPRHSPVPNVDRAKEISFIFGAAMICVRRSSSVICTDDRSFETRKQGPQWYSSSSPPPPRPPTPPPKHHRHGHRPHPTTDTITDTKTDARITTDTTAATPTRLIKYRRMHTRVCCPTHLTMQHANNTTCSALRLTPQTYRCGHDTGRAILSWYSEYWCRCWRSG
jgi:hypothetical protein